MKDIKPSTADKILKKYEDDNEYHFHAVDRKWIIAAMEEYATLRQPLTVSAMSSGGFGTTHYQITTNERRKHKR